MFPGKRQSPRFANVLANILDELARTFEPAARQSAASSNVETPQARTERLLANPLPQISHEIECKGAESSLVMKWNRGELDPSKLKIGDIEILAWFCIRHGLSDPLSLLVLHAPRDESGVDLLSIDRGRDTELEREQVKWLMQWAAVHGRPLSLILVRAIRSVESVQALATGLQFNKNLVALRIVQANMGADGARALGAALNYNSTLLDLTLMQCGLEHKAAGLLGTALKFNTGLRQLSLVMNNIGDEGSKALAEGIQENRTLRSLELHSCKIGDAGVHELCMALVHNTGLQKLDLGENLFGNPGAASIADVIKANPRIQALSVKACMVASQGNEQIITAIASNPNFKELCLDDEIGIGAIDQLLMALAAGLSKLSLCEAKIDKLQMQRIIQALEHNATLVELDLRGTELDDDCIDLLAKVLRSNRGLITVDLSFNHFGLGSVTALADALSSNLQIQKLELPYGHGPDREAPCARITASLRRNRKLAPYLAKSIVALDLMNRHSPVPLPSDQTDYMADFTVRYMAHHGDTYLSVLQNLSSMV